MNGIAIFIFFALSFPIKPREVSEEKGRWGFLSVVPVA